MNEYQKSKLNRVKRGANRATYDVAKINAILDAGFIGYVSYVFQGKAIAIPMAYGRLGNKIYLHGSQANRMLTSLTVMHLDALVLARSGFHHSVNYRSATIFGKAFKVEDKEEKMAGMKCFMEHMMPGRWDGVREINKQEFDRTLVVSMEIETASAKIRDVGVADEPEDISLPVWAGLVPLKQIAEYPVADKDLPVNVEIPKHVLDYYHKNKVH